MTNLYLRYRATTSDPWTQVPSLTSTFPSSIDGSVPILSAVIETSTEFETHCGCTESAVDDTYLASQVQTPPLPLAIEDTVLLYLLSFKSASLREMKLEHFGTGNYVACSLSLLHSATVSGMVRISFRLAATIADALV